MRIFISVDMEGIAGVSARDDVTRGTLDYERFRLLMTEEANAAIRGAFSGSATSVIVNDSHGNMRNLLYEKLDSRAELISGHNKPLCMAEGSIGTKGALFIGYHARAGTAHAVLDHTISSAMVANWWMNDILVSEAEINAALLSYYGVPVLLVSGDDQLAQQVQERLPGVATVVVKYGIDHRATRSLPRDYVYAAIEENCRLAVEHATQAPVHVTPGAVTFQLEFTRSFYAEVASLIPLVNRLDARTIAVTGVNVVEAWRWAYSALQLASTGDN